MRFFLSIMSSLLLLMTVMILTIKHMPLLDYCGASPVFNGTQSMSDSIYLDEQTGILLSIEAGQDDNRIISPDGQFSIELREDELFLSPLNSDPERLLYSSDTITSVNLADGRTVIVQEFDAISEEQQIISLDIERGNINFEYQYPASVRWQAINEQVTPYLYAQFLVNPEDNSQGLMFMNTVTGEITRFTDLTSGAYLPSESGRWLVSANRSGISIIDPATGDYHSHFPVPIPGGNFIWQGDEELWFARNGASGVSLWRAILADGRVEVVIENARLKALSADGRQAYVRNTINDDMILINTLTGEEQLLDTGGISTLQFNTPAFSPDGRCIAILLTNFPDVNAHQLWIIDTVTARPRLQLTLSGALNTLEWRNPGD